MMNSAPLLQTSANEPYRCSSCGRSLPLASARVKGSECDIRSSSDGLPGDKLLCPDCASRFTPEDSLRFLEDYEI